MHAEQHLCAPGRTHTARASLWIVNDPVDNNDWSSTQLDSIRRLLPHIRRYVCARQAFDDAGALGASLTELLETTESGIIQLDLRGRIVEMNDRARKLLRTGDGLFDKNGFLFARTPEGNAQLQELLNRALQPFRTQGVGGSTMVRRTSAFAAGAARSPGGPTRDELPAVWPVAALVLVVDPEMQDQHRSGLGQGGPRSHGDGKPGGGDVG